MQGEAITLKLIIATLQGNNLFLFLIPQCFDWLAAFHLELLQAIAV